MTSNMSQEDAENLLLSVKQAAKHARGEMVDGMKVIQIEIDPPSIQSLSPEEIKGLRKSVLKLTQKLFAKLCNVGETTVQGWESGTPVKGATLRLLDMYKTDPSLAKKFIKQKGYTIKAD